MPGVILQQLELPALLLVLRAMLVPGVQLLVPPP
jgi:hypothetical protein